jgi:hypothetical protein
VAEAERARSVRSDAWRPNLGLLPIEPSRLQR